jgi:NhaA family Na+:H+ antiporter
VVIAIFYTGSPHWLNLGIALSIFGFLLVLNRLKVRNLIPYLVAGVVMWYFMLHSGIHATIAGVLLAFAIPFGSGDEKSTSYILQHHLHRQVAFIILPIFALANTAFTIPPNWVHSLVELNSIGIFCGLFIGKPMGIFLFSYVSTILKLTDLPSNLTWSHIFAVGLLAGIGFTMSIFITLLAFDDEAIIGKSKLVVLITSVAAGGAGYLLLRFSAGAPNMLRNAKSNSVDAPKI